MSPKGLLTEQALFLYIYHISHPFSKLFCKLF